MWINTIQTFATVSAECAVGELLSKHLANGNVKYSAENIVSNIVTTVDGARWVQVNGGITV